MFKPFKSCSQNKTDSQTHATETITTLHLRVAIAGFATTHCSFFESNGDTAAYRDADCSDSGMWSRWITLQITDKTTGNISSSTRSQGRQRKRLIDNVTRGCVSKRK